MIIEYPLSNICKYGSCGWLVCSGCSVVRLMRCHQLVALPEAFFYLLIGLLLLEYACVYVIHVQ
jgi:hypothetical protein